MTKATAKRLAEKFEGEVYEGYSGRCMYGEKTYGVVLDSYGYRAFAKTKSFSRHRKDSLGYNYIVY